LNLWTILAGVVKWLGKPALGVGAIAASCALVLWATQYPEFAAAKAVVAPYRGWIEVGLISSIATLVAFLIAKLGAITGHVLTNRRTKATLKRELESLSQPEKEILRLYLSNGSRSLVFPIQESTVNGLVSRGILYQHGIGSIHSAPTHVNEYVWSEIIKHPNLLA
jgi:hypothetical protein